MQTQTVEFNKISNNNIEQVNGFKFTFLKLFNRDGCADLSIDFASNQDINELIEALEELKNK